MLTSDLNIYSLLIPSLVLCLSLITLLIAYNKNLGNYLVSYATGLFLIGVTIFLNTTLSTTLLNSYASILSLIYFSSCALHAQALYIRLKLPFSWRRCCIFMLLGMLGVAFFSHYYAYQNARIVSIALVTALIYLHRPILFFKVKTRLKIDYYLKIFTYVMLGLVLFRAGLIIALHSTEEYIAQNEGLWALTQLIIVFVNLVFFSLFVSSSIFDSITKLKQERLLDPLTGLLNRRGFNMYVAKLKAAMPYQNAILMADLDHFKNINDQYGHHIGDLALQHVSRLLQHNLREQDQVFRIGGEEFIILLAQVSNENADEIAERIRKNIEQEALLYQGQSINLSISIGISFFKHGQQLDTALLDADQLLYQAKKMGRNQVQRA